jgi:uncharacterized membrane protein
VAVCALTLAAGFALKAQCLGPAWDGRQYERLCYNDLQPLFGPRLHVTDESGEERYVFPYERGLVDGELAEGAIEYPVLTGLFMWASGHLADDSDAYLVYSALLLAPFGLAIAFLLARMTGWRALLWAAAPALVLYAFHNWDLLVVASAVLGFYLRRRGRPGWAAVAFGVGATFKLYPALFLAPLVLERLRARGLRSALGSAAAGLGTIAAINLPFVVKSFEGWWAPFEFHRLRGPNWDSIWTWSGLDFVSPELSSLSPAQINLVSALLVGSFAGAALIYGWLRARREGTYPFVPVCAALLAAFLAFNKVHSPQYALWILPFFALLSVNIAWWVGYAVVDLIVYVSVFRWFYDFVYAGADVTFAKRAMVFGVWARSLLLVGLFVAFLRSRPSRTPLETSELSHPSSRVTANAQPA